MAPVQAVKTLRTTVLAGPARSVRSDRIPQLYGQGDHNEYHNRGYWAWHALWALVVAELDQRWPEEIGSHNGVYNSLYCIADGIDFEQAFRGHGRNSSVSFGACLTLLKLTVLDMLRYSWCLCKSVAINDL